MLSHSESKALRLESPITDDPSYFWIGPKTEIMVLRIDGKVRAFHSVCPHMGARLVADPKTKEISCPWHGLSYSPDTLQSEHHKYKKLCEINVEVKGDQLFILGANA